MKQWNERCTFTECFTEFALTVSIKDETTHLFWQVVEFLVQLPVYHRNASLRQPNNQTQRPQWRWHVCQCSSLFITPTCDELVWQFSRLIGNNNRNCKLRILPDCHIGIWNIIYTVWECVISFCFSEMSLYSVFTINWPIWSCKFLFLSSWASCFHGLKRQWTDCRFGGILIITLKLLNANKEQCCRSKLFCSQMFSIPTYMYLARAVENRKATASAHLPKTETHYRGITYKQFIQSTREASAACADKVMLSSEIKGEFPP